MQGSNLQDILTSEEHAEAARESEAFLRSKFPEWYNEHGELAVLENYMKRDAHVKRDAKRPNPEFFEIPEVQEAVELLKSVFPDIDPIYLVTHGDEIESTQ